MAKAWVVRAVRVTYEGEVLFASKAFRSYWDAHSFDAVYTAKGYVTEIIPLLRVG